MEWFARLSRTVQIIVLALAALVAVAVLTGVVYVLKG